MTDGTSGGAADAETSGIGAAADLSAWREAFLEAGAARLEARERDDRDETIDRLQSKLGELTRDTELLQAKIDWLEAGGGGGPFGPRRSTR